MIRIVLLTALLLPTVARTGEQPQRPLHVPMTGGVCPSGYSASPTSGQCVPNPNTRQQAVPQRGYQACPPGYHSSMQSYCVENAR
jgi:hypothetical protein